MIAAPRPNEHRNPAILLMFSERRILTAESRCPKRALENAFFSGPLYQLNWYHSRFHKPDMALRQSRFESLPLNRRERRTSDSFANRLGLRVRSLLPQPTRAAFERTFNEVPAGREECGFRDSFGLRVRNSSLSAPGKHRVLCEDRCCRSGERRLP
jgi:hypothetical protein